MQVAFQTPGYGHFMPVAEAGASPYAGTSGTLDQRDTRLEILCIRRDGVRAAVAGMKK